MVNLLKEDRVISQGINKSMNSTEKSFSKITKLENWIFKEIFRENMTLAKFG